ncbi:hypothetical protein [Chondrinema litorale]|uniref:hypothetical protein n=1 Tax=Chondrinema litorale TaxID=2994555 RepID=UPI002542FA2A|nr:hypothetical protein [Chondrinema litorale]UZR95623.1 hypothetical protein OQ292_07350 [Chondrinema litorale]
MIKKICYFFVFASMLSCVEGDEPFGGTRPNADALTYIPVYANDQDYLKIQKAPAKAIENPAKIFTYNNYLIVNIKNEGFHVIDNSNPKLPQNLFFVEVPGNNDVAVKDGVIYADNYSDIVAFTVETNGELQILERIEDMIEYSSVPPFTNVYFECPDPNKGIVIDWIPGNVENPKCYR